jgi:hypothetical protein
MPREKVPYGGICGQAQKQKEMSVKLEKKLESINGVPGDAAHNVQIVASGDVTIANDEPNHKITVGAEWPVGAVFTSVGTTGTAYQFVNGGETLIGESKYTLSDGTEVSGINTLYEGSEVLPDGAEIPKPSGSWRRVIVQNVAEVSNFEKVN